MKLTNRRRRGRKKQPTRPLPPTERGLRFYQLLALAEEGNDNAIADLCGFDRLDVPEDVSDRGYIRRMAERFDAGAVPAEWASHLSPRRWLIHPSAICERQELPVQRISTRLRRPGSGPRGSDIGRWSVVIGHLPRHLTAQPNDTIFREVTK